MGCVELRTGKRVTVSGSEDLDSARTVLYGHLNYSMRVLGKSSVLEHTKLSIGALYPQPPQPESPRKVFSLRIVSAVIEWIVIAAIGILPVERFLRDMTRASFGAFCSPSTQIIAILSLIFLAEINTSPITNPHRVDGDINNVIPDYFDRKTTKAYHNSTPHDRKDVPIITYNSPDPDCNVGFKLAWSSTVGSPVYASPVIFPSGIGTLLKILCIVRDRHYFNLTIEYRVIGHSLQSIYQGLLYNKFTHP